MKQQPANGNDVELAASLTTLAARAAQAILRFDCRNVSARRKADRSMVTAADEAAERVILEGLSDLVPELPVVSEESAGAWRGRRPGSEFLLVDPLDGTAEFLAARDEYTVNIALVRGGVPVLGVVAAPALGLAWRASAGGAMRLTFTTEGEIGAALPIRTRPWPAQRVAAVSRSHYDATSAAFLERFAPVTQLNCGSALKFARVAEGAADLYPRLAPTSEWDVAAGHAVVVAAGGAVTAPDGGTLPYGAGADFLVPGFIAWGDPAAVRASTA